MMIPFREEMLMAFALPFVLLVMQALHSVYKRLYNYAMERSVEHLSRLIMAKEEPDDDDIRSLCLHYPTGVILDAAIFISEKIYGEKLYRLALIVEECRIGDYLLGQIWRKRGLQRVRNLSKLTYLTHDMLIPDYVEVYMEDESREVRFYALMVLVSICSNRAIRYIAQCKDLLTIQEVALLVRLMRRVGTPIAYTPLLASQNRNLQLVGLYLCTHFSIVDSEPHLQRLLESEDEEVAYMALQTLCSVRGNISIPQVGKVLSRSLSHQRNSFILHAVQNCYSLNSCAHHLAGEERRVFSQRINSYKCRMVCS